MAKIASTLSTVVALGVLVGCQQPNQFAPPPPPAVSVAQPVEETVTEFLEFTGTTGAYEDVDVRARVSGFLTSVNVTPGTRVNPGDILFEIDPREYEAELNAARAELASANAQLDRAKIELARAERLFKSKAGTDVEVVKWRGEKEVAAAAVLRGTSKVEQAELNLGYTRVSAPIGGRVSRNLVDAGNLVGESEPTLLASITNYTPMYVYFNLNERDLLRAMRLYSERVRQTGIDPGEQGGRALEIPLYVGLADEEGYPHEGRLDYADSQVDPGTGTLQFRGVFANKENPPKLLPGLFVRGRMPLQAREGALLVSERAIGSDQGGRYLLVVNSDNVVEKRSIRRGQLVDGLRVIEEGLQPGEWVIVKGGQKARPGAPAQPQRMDMNDLRVSALPADDKTAPPAESASDQP